MKEFSIIQKTTYSGTMCTGSEKMDLSGGKCGLDCGVGEVVDDVVCGNEVGARTERAVQIEDPVAAQPALPHHSHLPLAASAALPEVPRFVSIITRCCSQMRFCRRWLGFCARCLGRSTRSGG
ncbi:hypothetical protein BLNAU_8918 [Blattamonas nauphoetae]|uniref:Uncharacterized protein n=1 Tax=Blattamonas nauphoetae TaxID=2049346 RepID=A0ABQ9XXC8_9EUKA|nr:hypothetical protein BLNAU_8918 [Blattamonas nauphoetae]